MADFYPVGTVCKSKVFGIPYLPASIADNLLPVPSQGANEKAIEFNGA
jgi:hypothetical protein